MALIKFMNKGGKQAMTVFASEPEAGVEMVTCEYCNTLNRLYYHNKGYSD